MISDPGFSPTQPMILVLSRSEINVEFISWISSCNYHQVGFQSNRYYPNTAIRFPFPLGDGDQTTAKRWK